MPARLIVADVDGTTVFVHIAAASEEGLDEVMSARLAFVARLRFVETA